MIVSQQKIMKKTYHLCLSGGDEVLFRQEEDYVRGINCLCLATHSTGSSLLAYAFMSNHAHIAVRTEDPDKLMKAFRYPYNRYFNSKYGRRGRIGEDRFFCIEVNGLFHLLTAISYILRNPLHHGVSATPFGYRYSSISALFRTELGHIEKSDLMPEKWHYLYLPFEHKLPAGFKMDRTGLILPESVIDVVDIEHQFSTARTFLYYMNRISGEKWEKEQLNDNTDAPPVTLDIIEKGVRCQDIKVLLNNEHGRANYNSISDIQLCREIDAAVSGGSIYKTSGYELHKSAKLLANKFHASSEQIRRCFGGLI